MTKTATTLMLGGNSVAGVISAVSVPTQVNIDLRESDVRIQYYGRVLLKDRHIYMHIYTYMLFKTLPTRVFD